MVRTQVTHSAITFCSTCLFIPHCDAIYDQLLSRHTAAGNLFMVYYRIYSIKRLGRLFNFWTFRVGAYSRSGAYYVFTFSLSNLKWNFLFEVSLSEVGSLKSTLWGWGGVVWWALIRGWALINFFYLQGGRLFEVGAYSRLGA